jgi:hypothetical protein
VSRKRLGARDAVGLDFGHRSAQKPRGLARVRRRDRRRRTRGDRRRQIRLRRDQVQRIGVEY